MESNRRKGQTPVPDDFDSQLNEAQLAALRRAEGIGWSVKFVRGQKVVLVYEEVVHRGADLKRELNRLTGVRREDEVNVVAATLKPSTINSI